MAGGEVIWDWNVVDGSVPAWATTLALHDETLRDGIQCPSVIDPTISQKLDIVRRLSAIGVDTADIGLPGAGQRAIDDVTAIVQCIRDEGLSIRPAAAGRTHPNDIAPILAISEKTGVPLEVMAFLGSSPIRMLAEAWEPEKLESLTRQACKMTVEAGLPMSFVTEDTIRSDPQTLYRLFCAAVEEGADRLVLCDTVGHATPAGVERLVRWTHALLLGLGVRDRVRIDWHGHDDRGLSLINAWVAAEAGCDRVHGTILGIGERVGNTPLDLLLVNLRLLGADQRNLTQLGPLVDLVSEAVGRTIPGSYPVFGEDAFVTGTGVHAAAVIKAQRKGDQWLADRIYSGVPAGWFGRQQLIAIGHQSGESNIRYWLEQRDIDADEGLVKHLFAEAKRGSRLLADAEVHALVRAYQGS